MRKHRRGHSRPGARRAPLSLAARKTSRSSSVLGEQQVCQATLEQASDAIVICDAQGRLMFCNPAARRIADYNPDGTSLAEGALVWGDWFDRDGLRLPVEAWPVARALRGEPIVGQELHRRHADGSRTYIQISATPVRDAGGAITGAIATFTDITRVKQYEEALRAANVELEDRVRARTRALEATQFELQRAVKEHRAAAEWMDRSRRMMQAILDRSTAVIYVKDMEGRLQLVNSHFERLFGVSNAEVVGKTGYDLFPPEMAAPLEANDERVLASGEALHVEEVVPQSDGLHTYVSVKFPLRDDDGQMYALCGISTDITERQAMEAELRRSEARLSAVIESSTDIIFSVDRDYRLTACNGVLTRLFESLFGSPPRLGVPVSKRVPEDLVGRWFARLDRALAGERFTVEEVFPINGVVRHFLVSLNPTMTDGAISGVTVFAKDVTELKQAEEQARQHLAELARVLRLHTMGEMAASLAHEINQPLGAIANYAQGWKRRLQQGAMEADELAWTVEEIAREALRAGEITRRVRELLRKGEVRREAADLNTVVGAALEILVPAARRRAVTVHFRPADNLPHPEVDAIQIEQVVLNLVLNAFDAIDAGGGRREVEVSTRAADASLEVSVQDSGCGVDAALAERVFERFFTTKAGGLGMGLAISRSIIEAHGGRLWTSAAPDGGSIFRFVLPAAAAADTPSA